MSQTPSSSPCGRRQAIRSVLCVTKACDQDAAELGKHICAWLSERGMDVRQAENPESRGPHEKAMAQALRELSPGPQLILVLGGDGTMLSVARRLDCQAPLLGINLGRVGFLTELCPDDWQNRLGSVIEKGVTICERMALEYEVSRAGCGTPLSKGRVVNDLVISRGTLARLVPLQVTVDGEHLAVVRSDGLIVSTPTGATGYAVSAAGPLLHPQVRAYCVTAICPFMREFHPLVLPEQAVLELEVLESSAEVFVTQDGQEGFQVFCGDRITVRRATRGLCIVRLESPSYFAKLKAKGFVRDLANKEFGSGAEEESS